MSKLVLHLESAERTNLRLREELASVKQQLKTLKQYQQQSKTTNMAMNRDFEDLKVAQSGAETDLDRLRQDRAKLLVEKETWNTLHDTLKNDNSRLVQENTRLSILQDEVNRTKRRTKQEVDQWKDKYVLSERTVNELRSQVSTITIENERLLQERNVMETRLSSYEQETTERGFPRARRSPRSTPGITVKTVYQNDVRCWEPPREECYRDLIEFVKTQYDSTYIISYVDMDGDSVRIVNDSDCERAFQQARTANWDSIKFNVDLRAEIEVRKQYSDLELKHRKLKKQLQKLKKRHDNSAYKSLQGKAGRVVLDQMLQSYHSKFDDDLKGMKHSTFSDHQEQASLWSLKDQFARSVKGDLSNGWALIQIEVDNRKTISDHLGKKDFLAVRESISQYLRNFVSTLDGATFFDLHLCYMVLIRNQDEQSIKSVARNLLNIISERDLLAENQIQRIPGFDRITCSAGAVMYAGEEDYLRWSRKADEALEYGMAHGPNQVGNWEAYHLKRQGKGMGSSKRIPNTGPEMDPYISDIVRQTFQSTDGGL